jgi:cbb3-type cytochrome oxidase subunit 3
MEWPSHAVSAAALLVLLTTGVALQDASGARALGILSMAFLSLVALAVIWFQLRRAAERSRAEQQGHL